MIQIVIEDETKEFVVYEEAVEINKGTYKFTGNNTFEFTGDKFNFDLYYTKNLYITSFKNRLNQKHLEFEYASSATVHYG